MDAYLIESEASIYKFLGGLQLCGTLFPLSDGLIQNDDLTALVLDNINATWGGPWSKENIVLLDAAIEKLHNTPLKSEDKDRIEEIARNVRKIIGDKPKDDSEEAKQKKRDLFWETWSESLGGFVDSQNIVYFEADAGIAGRILELAENNVEVTQKLTMQDMNFSNIGFLSDKVFFVDPVYMKLGDPEFDRTVAGVNILLQLNNRVSTELSDLILYKFFRSKEMLAKLIVYYTFSSHKKLDKSQKVWQKFHQECAVVALKIFKDFEKKS